MPRPAQAGRLSRLFAVASCAALLPTAPVWAHAQQPATSAASADARTSAAEGQDDQDQGTPVGAQAGASHLFRRLLEGAGVVALGAAYLATRADGAGDQHAAASAGAVATGGPHVGRPETPAAAPGTNWAPVPSASSGAPTASGSGAATGVGAGSLPRFSGIGGSAAPRGGPGGGYVADVTPGAVAIVVSPEPSTAALLAVGAAGVAVTARRRRRAGR